MAENLKEIKARIKAINEEIKASKLVSKDLQDQLKTLRTLSKEARNLGSWESKRLADLNKIGQLEKSAVLQLQSKTKIGANLSKALVEQVSLNTQAVKGELDILDVAKQKNKIMSLRSQLAKQSKDMTQEQVVAAQEHIDKMEDGLDVAMDINEAAKERNKRAKLYSASVGEFVQKYDDFKDKVKDVLSSLSLKNVLLAGALGIVVGLGKLFFGLIKSSIGMQKELGVGAGHAMDLNIATREAAAGGFMYGESIEDVAGRASTLVEEWGVINQETKNSIEAATDLERMYGVSTTAAANLAQMMEATSTSTKDVLLSDMQSQMAELQKEGVPVGKIMEEVAGDTEFFAKFMKSGGKNVIKAAAFAKKLGMSMETISGAANSLLDWEQSINAEMEASVLLGREVNMERARELAFAGDLEGMQREIMRQVGSEAEFARMNVVQREALAAAAGVSVTDLTKMVAAEAKLGKMTSKERKDQERNSKVTKNIQSVWQRIVEIFRTLYKKYITPISNYLLEILGFTGGIESGLKGQEEVWSNITGFVDKSFKWIEGIVKSVIEWFKVMGTGKDNVFSLETMFKNIWESIKGIFLKAAAVYGIFRLITGLRFNIGGGGKGGIMSSLTGGMKSGQIIAGAAAIVILSAAVWVLAKAMQEFSTGVNWKGVAMGIVSMLSLAGVGIVLGMFAPVGIAGAAVMVILAGAMWVMGKAMQEFAKAAVIVIPVLETLFEGIALIVNTIAGSFVKMLDAIVISFRSFAEMGREGGLLSAAAGMTAISVALGLFGGGSLLSGIGSAIGDFFGGDPIKKFQSFGALGPGLDQTSTAIKNLKINMQDFKNIGIRDIAGATQLLAKSLIELAKASHKVNKSQRAALRTQAMKGFGQAIGLVKEDSPVGRQAGTGGGGVTQSDVTALRNSIAESNRLLIQIRDNAGRHSRDNVGAIEGAIAQN